MSIQKGYIQDLEQAVLKSYHTEEQLKVFVASFYALLNKLIIVCETLLFFLLITESRVSMVSVDEFCNQGLRCLWKNSIPRLNVLDSINSLNIQTNSWDVLALLGLVSLLHLVIKKQYHWIEDNPRGAIAGAVFVAVLLLQYFVYICETPHAEKSYYDFLQSVGFRLITFIGGFVFFAIDGRQKKLTIAKESATLETVKKEKLETSLKALDNYAALYRNGDVKVEHYTQCITNYECYDALVYISSYIKGVDPDEKELLRHKLQRLYLKGLNLAGADLSNVPLEYANLQYCDLNHANLSGANFINANLIGANLFDVEYGNTPSINGVEPLSLENTNI